MPDNGEPLKLRYSIPKCSECRKPLPFGAAVYGALDTGQKYLPVVALCDDCWKKHCFPPPDVEEIPDETP